MKKALVLALTAFMVLALATAAFAVEVSYEGKVAVKWGGESQGDVKDDPNFDQDALEAKVVIDFTKDYGDGVSAGVTTKVEAHDKNTLEFDGAGWVQLERDLFTLKAATEIDDGVGKDFGEFNIPGAPGLSLNLNLVDGLTLTTVVNAGDPAYNYVVKGEYAQDLFTIGGGFQSSAQDKTSAFGVYGSVNPMDGLTVNAEYGNRNLDTEDDDLDPISAILASAAYEVGALNVKGTFLMQDAGFINMNDDDADQDWRIIDAIRFTGGGLADNTAVAIDASYNLTDALKLEGYFDYLLSQKIGDQKVEELKDNYAYKAGAVYTLDALTLSGWYKANGSQKSQFGGNATYKLAEGAEASFEVTSTTDKLVSDDAKLAYTAKITATL